MIETRYYQIGDRLIWIRIRGESFVSMVWQDGDWQLCSSYKTADVLY